MKNKLFMGCLVVATSLLLAGCGSSKKLAQAKADGMVEVTIPLTGPEYRTDKEYYRAVQSGISPNTSMAKKIAMQNAREELASAIKADLSVVIENYGKGQDVDNTQEYQGQYQGIAYTVVDEQLTGVAIAEEKLFKQENGSYKYYICLQINKNELKDKIANKISKQNKLQLEFDLDRFRKVYDEQMNAFQKK